jgi:hypothetical protein
MFGVPDPVADGVDVIAQILVRVRPSPRPYAHGEGLVFATNHGANGVAMIRRLVGIAVRRAGGDAQEVSACAGAGALGRRVFHVAEQVQVCAVADPPIRLDFVG